MKYGIKRMNDCGQVSSACWCIINGRGNTIATSSTGNNKDLKRLSGWWWCHGNAVLKWWHPGLFEQGLCGWRISLIELISRKVAIYVIWDVLLDGFASIAEYLNEWLWSSVPRTVVRCIYDVYPGLTAAGPNPRFPNQSIRSKSEFEFVQTGTNVISTT